ncbi:MAG TPA: class F sortase [Mycobacteriales bacterium]
MLGAGAGIRDLERPPAVTAPDLGALPSTAAPTPAASRAAPTKAAPKSKSKSTSKSRTASAGPLLPAAPAAPGAVTLPGQKVTAPVVAMGVRRDGELEIPESVGTVGWWVGSAPAGATRGSTVLAGHIDSASQGVGAFAALRDLSLGSPVVLTDVFGERHPYTVTARRTYPKYSLPRSVFSAAPLVLVTCGGPFDEKAGSYRDNIVVYAVPS